MGKNIYDYIKPNKNLLLIFDHIDEVLKYKIQEVSLYKLIFSILEENNISYILVSEEIFPGKKFPEFNIQSQRIINYKLENFDQKESEHFLTNLLNPNNHCLNLFDINTKIKFFDQIIKNSNGNPRKLENFYRQNKNKFKKSRFIACEYKNRLI